MIALAMDTTTDRLSVAARSNGRTARREVQGVRLHAARLFPLIEEVLEELELPLPAVEALAVADGPGSFTGLRVGASAVKALSRAQPALSVWTASNLLVRAVGAAPPRGVRVLVVTSALRGELYAATYRFDVPNTVETLMAPTLAVPESLHRETPDLVVADAPDRLVDRLADQFNVPLIRGPMSLPSASALLGLLEIPGGAQRIENVDDWQPSYGRMAEAQARWEAAHGRPLPDPASDAR